MGAVDLKHKVLEIINSSDERFLRMVNALHKSYSTNKDDNFFNELPIEIQELLMDSRTQAKKGNTRTHSQVMADFREKYNMPS